MKIPDCECTECIEHTDLPESVEMTSQEVPESVDMPSADEDAADPTEDHTAYKSRMCRKDYTEAEIIHSFLQIINKRSIQVFQ